MLGGQIVHPEIAGESEMRDAPTSLVYTPFGNQVLCVFCREL